MGMDKGKESRNCMTGWVLIFKGKEVEHAFGEVILFTSPIMKLGPMESLQLNSTAIWCSKHLKYLAMSEGSSVRADSSITNIKDDSTKDRPCL
ncbi:hypothetical protein I7I48_02288 [Histoplasma ohiense]|nr:hypothetical protein I7I48_02288 [Histoplasma ohiense (nom. inval.)]